MGMKPLTGCSRVVVVSAFGLLLLTPQSGSAATLASDNFQVPPYVIGALAGQAAGGTGFKGSWIHETGLTQDLSVNSNGVVGRPAVPSGSAGDYLNFASPFTPTGQLFISYTLSNLGSVDLSATRIDLNFGTTPPFTGSRAFFGGFGLLAPLNFYLEAGLSAGNTVVTVNSTIPSTGSHHLIGVLDVQNHQVALFVDPTSSSYYSSTGANNATITAPWTPNPALVLYSYSLIENANTATPDVVNFGNVIFATDPVSVGLGQGSVTSGTLFTYNGFSNKTGLTLVGNAITTATSDGTVLRLTPAVSSQSGAAYATTPVTLGNNATFSTRFQFRFTGQGGQDPADGITFVMGTTTTGLGGLWRWHGIPGRQRQQRRDRIRHV